MTKVLTPVFGVPVELGYAECRPHEDARLTFTGASNR